MLEIQEIERRLDYDRLDYEDLTHEDDRRTKEDMLKRVKWYDGEPRMKASSSSSSGILRSHAQSNSHSRSRSRSGSMSQCLELEVERQNKLLKCREFLKETYMCIQPRISISHRIIVKPPMHIHAEYKFRVYSFD